MPPRSDHALTVLVVREADAKVHTLRLSRRALVAAGSLWLALACAAAAWGFPSAGRSAHGRASCRERV